MRTSEEVEAEVEDSRSNLDRNVEALKLKMTPGQLFDEAARMMGGTGQQVASKFADQAKANPMPLAVMGLGLAWLMMSNSRSQPASGGRADGLHERRSFGPTPFEDAVSRGGSGGESLGDRASGLAENLQDKAHALGDKAHGLLSGVQDKVASAGASAAATGRSAGEGLSSMASGARDKASEVGQQAQRTLLDALEKEPLLLAGVGVVVGAVIGAALPHTDAEDRAMGETRDRLLEKGKDLAETGLDKAGTAAQATYEAVKTELSHGDGGDAADRLGEAARSGARAAQEKLQGPSH